MEHKFSQTKPGIILAPDGIGQEQTSRIQDNFCGPPNINTMASLIFTTVRGKIKLTAMPMPHLHGHHAKYITKRLRTKTA